ncbi:MAG: hypothetical protein P8N76_20275 [Pirellulaceae bacterium]|nr:hypothetical protein [Pirellulaceae bacterium]
MSRPKKGQRKAPQPSPADLESRTAVAATVAWMLALMSTIAAECSGIFVRILLMTNDASDRLRVLSTTLLLVAFLSGTITLILTPVASRLRRTAPPRSIVIIAYIMGIVPLITIALLSMLP